jgi:hypothetical protein
LTLSELASEEISSHSYLLIDKLAIRCCYG